MLATVDVPTVTAHVDDILGLAADRTRDEEVLDTTATEAEAAPEREEIVDVTLHTRIERADLGVPTLDDRVRPVQGAELVLLHEILLQEEVILLRENLLITTGRQLAHRQPAANQYTKFKSIESSGVGL